MLAVIDVGNWQNVIELKSGKELNLDGNQYQEIRKILSAHPYPGDMSEQSIGWVTDTAQSACDMYAPQFMLLCYTQPLFIEMHTPENKAESIKRQQDILENVRRFAGENGYESVVVLTSGYVPLKGEIRELGTKGDLESWAWGTSVAGISGAQAGDREILQNHAHIQTVIEKSEFFSKHTDLNAHFQRYFPDYIVVAEDGYAFRGRNSHRKKIYMADLFSDKTPICSTIGLPNHIRDTHHLIRKALSGGKKVLLTVIEGYRADSIPEGFSMCGNADDWYAYRGLDFYLALFTGKPFYQTEFPPVYDRTKPKETDRSYPLSGFFRHITADAIGDIAGVRSAAVSSRSMVIHMAVNADITVECYSREHAQMGVMAAFKEDKFKAADRMTDFL